MRPSQETAQTRQILLFAMIVVTLQHVAYARQDSGKKSGWTAGWSWGRGGPAASHGGLKDDELIEMLYTRASRSHAEHPPLKRRLEFRRSYEVTEHPDNDWPLVDHGLYSSPYDAAQDIPQLDNALHEPQQTFSSSSSTFMSSSDNGDSLRTAYSHKIIHN